MDNVWALSSINGVTDVYNVYYEKRCNEVLVCTNGEWVHKEYKDCTEELAYRIKLSMVLDIDPKERLKSDLSAIYAELKSYLKK